MSPAFEKIMELSKELTEDERLKIVTYLQQPLIAEDDDEDEWESRMLRTVLADYIDEGGKLDYEKLDNDGDIIDLEELRPKDKIDE